MNFKQSKNSKIPWWCVGVQYVWCLPLGLFCLFLVIVFMYGLLYVMISSCRMDVSKVKVHTLFQSRRGGKFVLHYYVRHWIKCEKASFLFSSLLIFRDTILLNLSTSHPCTSKPWMLISQCYLLLLTFYFIYLFLIVAHSKMGWGWGWVGVGREGEGCFCLVRHLRLCHQLYSSTLFQK